MSTLAAKSRYLDLLQMHSIARENDVSFIEVSSCRVKNGGMINYSWIVSDYVTGKCIIIDPAHDFQEIKKRIKRTGCELSAVLLTHHHYDHVNLSSDVSEYFNVTVYISRVEKERYGMNFHNVETFGGNEYLKIPGISVYAMSTPGHTAGSTCYLIGNSIFTGDTLFNEGCGLCECEGGSAESMFYTLKNLKQSITDDVRVYPGHRYHTELGLKFSEVKKMNIYLNIDDIDLFVKFRNRRFSTRGAFNFI